MRSPRRSPRPSRGRARFARSGSRASARSGRRPRLGRWPAGCARRHARRLAARPCAPGGERRTRSIARCGSSRSATRQRAEHEAVLDALRGALAHERQHRVGGVAQQRHPPARPRLERRPIEQRPLEDLSRCPRSAPAPADANPRTALSASSRSPRADQDSSRQSVARRVRRPSSRAGPTRRSRSRTACRGPQNECWRISSPTSCPTAAGARPRQATCRHQIGAVRAGDVLADHRVDAVGADQQVAGRVAPVGEADRDLVVRPARRTRSGRRA